MPGLKVQSSPPAENDEISQIVEQDISSFDNSELPIPEKPNYNKVDENLSNTLVVKPPKGNIEVIALRKGFIGQRRIVVGEKFTIPSVDRLGSWMKYADPALERQRQKEKKAKK